jgi:hypothetical protein
VSRISKLPLLLVGVAAFCFVLLAASGTAGLPFLFPLFALAIPLLFGRFPGEDVLARMRERRSGRRQTAGSVVRERPPSLLVWVSALLEGGAAPRGPPPLSLT